MNHLRRDSAFRHAGEHVWASARYGQKTLRHITHHAGSVPCRPGSVPKTMTAESNGALCLVPARVGSGWWLEARASKPLVRVFPYRLTFGDGPGEELAAVATCARASRNRVC